MPKPRRIVVAGAGLAGLRAVEQLRRLGSDADISLIGRENVAPYDRPPLSKHMLWSAAAEPPRTLSRADLVRDLGIDLRLSTEVTGIDANARTVTLTGQQVLPYDQLLIATGARARSLPATAAFPNVHTLRSYDDCMRLRAALSARCRLVVVGAGFIGTEIAAGAVRAGLDVTIAERLPVPLGTSLGPVPGARLAALHRDAGVRLITGVGVTAVTGQDRADTVRLSDGRCLAADEVVIGLGALPDVDWLRGSQVTVVRGIRCDEFGRTTAPGVWAAGDAAEYLHRGYAHHIVVEHWFNAHEQGAAVARNMLADDGELAEYRPLPYFWSEQHGVRIQVLGRPDPAAEPVAVTVQAPRAGVVYLYGEADRLSAAVSFGVPAKLIALRSFIQRGASLAEAADLIRGDPA
jgi:NADPH-dependent 2,4-dienoyl-CoA reductase/sulfur reductase-like enzyme